MMISDALSRVPADEAVDVEHVHTYKVITPIEKMIVHSNMNEDV